jgi:phage tail sheath protein FI
MPEYLTPGVYVEETSFRSRSIEGVPTSTFGMAGRTEYGPVPYVAGGVAMMPGATPVTSYVEYERAFGGLTVAGEPCLLALAARAFFANGGRRLYVARVFPFTMTPATPAAPAAVDVDRNFASVAVPAGNQPLLRWRARWPGSLGSRIRVSVNVRRSKNVLIGGVLTGVRPGAAVEVAALTNGAPPVISDDTGPVAGNVKIVLQRDQVLGYRGAQGAFEPVAPNTAAFHLTLAVTVTLAPDRADAYSELELDRLHPRSVFKVLEAADPADEFSLVWLEEVPRAAGQQAPTPGELLAALLTLKSPGVFLAGGGDGTDLTATDLAGKEASPDDAGQRATGLAALAEEEDIAIVAMPDTVNLPDEPQRKEAVDALIGHATKARYRIAIVDPPRDSSISEVRAFRSQFDTSYGALYYPWLRTVDPTARPDPGNPSPPLDVPPSGHVAGIYARSDIERGVHKAPANEVILGVTKFVTNVTFDRQSLLNPEGINALRFFEGRANRVWGARTMSSDPEWKYVNVRRLFIYLEHSIEKSTQWAVFEPNNERLWSSIRQTIEDFLLTVWRSGALTGSRPEDAFFVRCDRTTMTQNDLDNGRLICLIGVAPTYPAEFVIFRIGQFTADAQRS